MVWVLVDLSDNYYVVDMFGMVFDTDVIKHATKYSDTTLAIARADKKRLQSKYKRNYSLRSIVW